MIARRTIVAVAFALGIGASTARAYSTPGLYAGDPASTGGAGGRTFTGAPADGFTCSVCHTGGATTRHALVGGPSGIYDPGATYAFELRWPGERVGLTVEAADLDGNPLGVLVAPPVRLQDDDERCTSGGAAIEAIALDDGRAPLGLSECGAERLRLQWTAPAVPIDGALYLSLVVGDGDGTPEGDAVEGITVPLRASADAGGCAVARSSGSSVSSGSSGSSGSSEPGPLALALALLGLARGRRRRRGRGAVRAAGARLEGAALGASQRRGLPTSLAVAVAVAVAIAATGCARVQPYERGRLAQPDMKMSDDHDLETGPEHALDYREGSAGGLGGGAGGCGCN
ncbi:MAG: DUF4266 domain-containing protein [Nannocystaceae bacterium]